MAQEIKGTGKGRGWRGDSARHAEAGRLGGRARRRKNTDVQVEQSEEVTA